MKKASINTFPAEPHYAALVFTTQHIHHEGDERSRTNPGHGYPAHTETINSIDYIILGDSAGAEAWIKETEGKDYRYSDKPKYKVIQANPCNVQTSIQVKL